MSFLTWPCMCNVQHLCTHLFSSQQPKADVMHYWLVDWAWPQLLVGKTLLLATVTSSTQACCGSSYGQVDNPMSSSFLKYLTLATKKSNSSTDSTVTIYTFYSCKDPDSSMPTASFIMPFGHTDLVSCSHPGTQMLLPAIWKLATYVATPIVEMVYVIHRQYQRGYCIARNFESKFHGFCGYSTLREN